MVTKQRKSTGIAQAVLLGDLAAGILTIIITAVVATMWNKDAISETTVKSLAAGTHFLSAFAGAWTTGKISAGKTAASIASASLYFLLLVTVGVFGFGGELNGVVSGVVAAAVGATLGIIVVMRRNKMRSHRKRKTRSR